MTIRSLLARLRSKPFEGSVDYWEDRYSAGGTSGAGSYGDGAQYKAEIVNRVVADLAAESVVEFGCGDGNQLKLADFRRYVGLDVSRKAIEICTTLFEGDGSKSFEVYDPHQFGPSPEKFDLALSLGVIFHIVEDDLFDLYMTHLFDSASKAVLIMSSDEERSARTAHVRRRSFTPWIAENRPDWALASRFENPRSQEKVSGARSDFFLFVPRDPVGAKTEPDDSGVAD